MTRCAGSQGTGFACKGERVIVPVTNRGDAIGLLELLLPATPDKGVLEAVGQAAQGLAYVVIANGRFTGLYTWGKRSRPAHPGSGDPVPAAARVTVVRGR